MQVRIQQLGPGMMQQIQSMCGECQGQGERIDPKLRCKKCNGRKVNRERKILEVSVDKGMADSQKITFTGMAIGHCYNILSVGLSWGQESLICLEGKYASGHSSIPSSDLVVFVFSQSSVSYGAVGAITLHNCFASGILLGD